MHHNYKRPRSRRQHHIQLRHRNSQSKCYLSNTRAATTFPSIQPQQSDPSSPLITNFTRSTTPTSPHLDYSTSFSQILTSGGIDIVSNEWRSRNENNHSPSQPRAPNPTIFTQIGLKHQIQTPYLKERHTLPGIQLQTREYRIDRYNTRIPQAPHFPPSRTHHFSTLITTRQFSTTHHDNRGHHDSDGEKHSPNPLDDEQNTTFRSRKSSKKSSKSEKSSRIKRQMKSDLELLNILHDYHHRATGANELDDFIHLTTLSLQDPRSPQGTLVSVYNLFLQSLDKKGDTTPIYMVNDCTYGNGNIEKQLGMKSEDSNHIPLSLLSPDHIVKVAQKQRQIATDAKETLKDLDSDVENGLATLKILLLHRYLHNYSISKNGHRASNYLDLPVRKEKYRFLNHYTDEDLLDIAERPFSRDDNNQELMDNGDDGEEMMSPSGHPIPTIEPDKLRVEDIPAFLRSLRWAFDPSSIRQKNSVQSKHNQQKQQQQQLKMDGKNIETLGDGEMIDGFVRNPTLLQLLPFTPFKSSFIHFLDSYLTSPYGPKEKNDALIENLSQWQRYYVGHSMQIQFAMKHNDHRFENWYAATFLHPMTLFFYPERASYYTSSYSIDDGKVVYKGKRENHPHHQQQQQKEAKRNESNNDYGNLPFTDNLVRIPKEPQSITVEEMREMFESAMEIELSGAYFDESKIKSSSSTTSDTTPNNQNNPTNTTPPTDSHINDRTSKPHGSQTLSLLEIGEMQLDIFNSPMEWWNVSERSQRLTLNKIKEIQRVKDEIAQYHDMVDIIQSLSSTPTFEQYFGTPVTTSSPEHDPKDIGDTNNNQNTDSNDSSKVSDEEFRQFLRERYKDDCLTDRQFIDFLRNRFTQPAREYIDAQLSNEPRDNVEQSQITDDEFIKPRDNVEQSQITDDEFIKPRDNVEQSQITDDEFIDFLSKRYKNGKLQMSDDEFVAFLRKRFVERYVEVDFSNEPHDQVADFCRVLGCKKEDLGPPEISQPFLDFADAFHSSAQKEKNKSKSSTEMQMSEIVKDLYGEETEDLDLSDLSDPSDPSDPSDFSDSCDLPNPSEFTQFIESLKQASTKNPQTQSQRLDKTRKHDYNGTDQDVLSDPNRRSRRTIFTPFPHDTAIDYNYAISSFVHVMAHHVTSIGTLQNTILNTIVLEDDEDKYQSTLCYFPNDVQIYLATTLREYRTAHQYIPLDELAILQDTRIKALTRVNREPEPRNGMRNRNNFSHRGQQHQLHQQQQQQQQQQQRMHDQPTKNHHPLPLQSHTSNFKLTIDNIQHLDPDFPHIAIDNERMMKKILQNINLISTATLYPHLDFVKSFIIAAQPFWHISSDDDVDEVRLQLAHGLSATFPNDSFLPAFFKENLKGNSIFTPQKLETKEKSHETEEDMLNQLIDPEDPNGSQTYHQSISWHRSAGRGPISPFKRHRLFTSSSSDNFPPPRDLTLMDLPQTDLAGLVFGDDSMLSTTKSSLNLSNFNSQHLRLSSFNPSTYYQHQDNFITKHKLFPNPTLVETKPLSLFVTGRMITNTSNKVPDLSGLSKRREEIRPVLQKIAKLRSTRLQLLVQWSSSFNFNLSGNVDGMIGHCKTMRVEHYRAIEELSAETFPDKNQYISPPFRSSQPYAMNTAEDILLLLGKPPQVRKDLGFFDKIKYLCNTPQPNVQDIVDSNGVKPIIRAPSGKNQRNFKYDPSLDISPQLRDVLIEGFDRLTQRTQDGIQKAKLFSKNLQTELEPIAEERNAIRKQNNELLNAYLTNVSRNINNLRENLSTSLHSFSLQNITKSFSIFTATRKENYRLFEAFLSNSDSHGFSTGSQHHKFIIPSIDDIITPPYTHDLLRLQKHIQHFGLPPSSRPSPRPSPRQYLPLDEPEPSGNGSPIPGRDDSSPLNQSENKTPLSTPKTINTNQSVMEPDSGRAPGGPIIVGDEPIIMGDEPIIMGDGPIIMGDEPIIMGDGPIIMGDEPIIMGDGPIIMGDGPIIMGGAPPSQPSKPESPPMSDNNGGGGAILL